MTATATSCPGWMTGPETKKNGWLLPWEGNHILIELPLSKPQKMGPIKPEDEIRVLWLMQQGFYSFLGTDTHNKRYTDEFDKLIRPEAL